MPLPNRPNRRASVTDRLSVNLVGLFLGALCFSAALAPSLIPRAGLMQGVLSGASFVLGYAVGSLATLLWQFLGLRVMRRDPRITRSVLVLALLVMVYGLWRAALGQESLHVLMGLPPIESVRPMIVLAVAGVVAAVLMLLGRVFGLLWGMAARKLAWLFPERLALVLGFALAALVFGFFGNTLLLRQVLGGLDITYQRMDAAMSDVALPPTDPRATGSAASLIGWDGIGAEGRNRVADPLDAAEIAAITGAPALDPLRIYVGLGSAPDPQARAAFALAEALRVEAFARKTLVIATPTGTGWIDPAGTYPLEVMTGGDVATISVQYSYLPSWLSLLTVPEYGAETARAVFAAIHGHWKTLPRESRPKLYLFGLSLGALNADLAADFYDIVADPYDGAFWVGPPFAHDSWVNITADRQPDSPAWLPRFREGDMVRFLNQYEMPDAGRRWAPLRIVILQYASDPITFFSPSTFWRRPDWMADPRGPDVSEQMRWLPLVTGLQLGFDVMTATTAPRGFGHVYAGEDYQRGWEALLEPEGWSAEAAARLRAGLAARDL